MIPFDLTFLLLNSRVSDVARVFIYETGTWIISTLIFEYNIIDWSRDWNSIGKLTDHHNDTENFGFYTIMDRSILFFPSYLFTPPECRGEGGLNVNLTDMVNVHIQRNDPRIRGFYTNLCRFRIIFVAPSTLYLRVLYSLVVRGEIRQTSSIVTLRLANLTSTPDSYFQTHFKLRRMFKY